MAKELEEKIKEYYSEYSKNKLEVLDVFTDYFGEDLVDCDENIENIIKEISSYTFQEISEITHTTFNGEDPGQKLTDVCTEDTISQYDSIIEILVDKVTNRTMTIIVKFPEVRVTNEDNKYIDIKDLYARILVSSAGKLLEKISLLRATYTATQYLSNYAHSHLPTVSTHWQIPCYGRGPILSTMNILMDKKDLNYWGLLCYELSKFVTVESLEGIPYKRLESVGTYSELKADLTLRVSKMLKSYYSNPIKKDGVKNFIAFFLKTNDLKFSYYQGEYNLGETNVSFWLKVSKAFAYWYNEKYLKGEFTASLDTLINTGVITPYVVDGNEVYYKAEVGNFHKIKEVNGTPLFDFKGDTVKLNILDTASIKDLHITYLIDYDIVRFLLTSVLRVINYKYGRTNTETDTKKRCFYI